VNIFVTWIISQVKWQGSESLEYNTHRAETNCACKLLVLGTRFKVWPNQRHSIWH